MSDHRFRDCLLIAMPHVGGTRFRRAVIYMCKHDESGAMGLLVNRKRSDVRFDTLLQQFKLEADDEVRSIPLFMGGPVDNAHGFILHTPEYKSQGTIECGVCRLSSSVEVLRDIANGQGPERFNVTLGYAGWQPGQLEQEILRNDWIIAKPNLDFVFNHNINHKWEDVLRELGISEQNLSSHVGHA